MPITDAQCRMARSALRLSVRELASQVGVSANTITAFENGRPAYRRTVEAIRAALEAAGVEFTNGDAPGVRLRPRQGDRAGLAGGEER